MSVFKPLVVYLPLDHIKSTVIKRIVDLPSLKSPYTWRKIGFEMFCALADAKGEEGFKQEPTILKYMNSMCIDTNWKIRR